MMQHYSVKQKYTSTELGLYDKTVGTISKNPECITKGHITMFKFKTALFFSSFYLLSTLTVNIVVLII